jgi:acyl-CoA synthetase (AMP-forming)/AMP-acid ligase II
MGLYDFTFYDLICRNAHLYENNAAWYEADNKQTFTFGEVRQQVDRLAAILQHVGIVKGDRIGVLGKNSFEYFVLYGAISALGAIALPINWRLSAEEIQFCLNDGEPKILFVDAEYQDLVSQIRPGLTSVVGYYNLKDDAGGFTRIKSLSGPAHGLVCVDIDNDDGFMMVHTAAVAGRPRGALLSHGNVICTNLHLFYNLGIRSEDVHLNVLPMFHVAGLFMAFSSFHAGALNVNMSRFDAESAAALIEEKGVTVLFDFSPVLASILEAGEKIGKNISSLKTVAGIETLQNIEHYRKTIGGTFYCLYGQTETAGFATLSRYDQCPGSAGKALTMARVRIVDDEDRALSAGEIGEIAVKGPMIFKGYWNLPEDTDYTFRNGWHHTGDLGRFDADGFLWYEGRKAEKELIKPGGENVYPAEVERAVLEHPAVAAVVVIGVPDPKWKEAIKAVCRLKSGAQLDAPTLIRFVGERIASYKKPQYVEFISDFPTLSNGAPDREKIKSRHGGK